MNDAELGLAPLDDAPARKSKPTAKETVTPKPPAREEEELAFADLADDKPAIKPPQKKVITTPVAKPLKPRAARPAATKPPTDKTAAKSPTTSGSPLQNEIPIADIVSEGSLLDELMAGVPTVDAMTDRYGVPRENQ